MCCRRIGDELGGVHVAVDLEVEVEQIPSWCGWFRHDEICGPDMDPAVGSAPC
jgi:hypothetical protein